jgi:hypothetical protein
MVEKNTSAEFDTGTIVSYTLMDTLNRESAFNAKQDRRKTIKSFGIGLIVAAGGLFIARQFAIIQDKSNHYPDSTSKPRVPERFSGARSAMVDPGTYDSNLAFLINDPDIDYNRPWGCNVPDAVIAIQKMNESKQLEAAKKFGGTILVPTDCAPVTGDNQLGVFATAALEASNIK